MGLSLHGKTDLWCDEHVPAVSGDFVRADEWRRVREFATTAADRGEPAALVVAGEAGAGKSRLWRAAVTAGAAECQALRSEPSASEADSPFAGLSDLLSNVLPSVTKDIPAPQREALEVALLIRPAGDQPPAAHAIGRAVLAALRSCLTAGPVLIAIDDVQWLDAGSLEVLEFALRRIGGGPLSLLLAARTEAPADPLTVGAPPLSQRWRGLLTAFPDATEITLAPLDLSQVQDLLPAAATSAQARLIAGQSRGNPFWARMIWGSMMSTAADHATDPVTDPAPGAPSAQQPVPRQPLVPRQPPVPPLARAALAGRLERSLTEPAAEALTVVAAAGRIAVADAVAVLDQVPNPGAALDAAVLAGVVVETEARLAPAHPLIGAAAIEAVPPARRALIYQRLASVSASPERRAQFTALAAQVIGTGPDPSVASALDEAAEAAHARAANAAAAKFAAQAVTFTPRDDTAALARRHIRAGELLDVAGEFSDALGHLGALDTNALPAADLERALPLLVALTDVVSGMAAATALITRALDTAGQDDRRRALVLSLASDLLYGVPGQRLAAAGEAIRRAEAAGPAANESLHRALTNLAAAKVLAGEGLDSGLLARAEELEAIVPGIPLYATADMFRGMWSSRYVDDLDTARAALLRCVARARDTGDDFTLFECLCYLALTEELAGDYRTAASLLAESDDVASSYDWPQQAWLLEPRCELLIAAGELDEALRVADERLPDDDSQPVITRFMGAYVRGKVSACARDAAAAVRHLELAAHYAGQLDWAEPGARSRLDGLLAETYITVGRVSDARRISGWLRELGARMDRPTLTGNACRIDALAAAEAGDLRAAAECARDAVVAHERSPLRPELTLSLLALGRIERRRKARGAARAALLRARDLALGIGHQPLLAAIEAELSRVPATRSATELTDAEQRVVEQIAAGATNREAAAALFISVRTVETHIASVYRKLGIRSRSELRRALSAGAVPGIPEFSRTSSIPKVP
jgi:DNA-binding CsgD family transcriptional regulator